MQKHIDMSNASPVLRLRMVAYYAQRVITSRWLRNFATIITVLLLKIFRRQVGPTDRRKSSSVLMMRATGYLRLNQLLSSKQISEIHSYLKDKMVVAARGTGESFHLHEVPTGVATADYPLETVVNCPHVLQLANDPQVLALATSYIGFTPTITLMGMRWSFPGDQIDVDVQRFHRDLEMGSIKLLVYLTDVDVKSGPHNYVQGTHLDRRSLRLRRYSDEDVLREHGGSVIITGTAGTAFAIDTNGIHKGTPPISRPRLLLSLQYSLLPCLNYDYKPVDYSGDYPVNAYINRLMVKRKLTGESEKVHSHQEDMIPH